MALIILEGLDRTGKSSVAKHFEAQGYELIHQSAPAKGLSADLYLEEQMALVSSAAHKDIVLDRSYYGELVWPFVYSRDSLLSDEGLEVLRELEQSVGTTRIMMVDPDVEGHWKRCVENKEPLTRNQFVTARRSFNTIADTYGFARKTIKDFALQSEDLLDVPAPAADPVADNRPSSGTPQASPKQTKEQLKLETANAINDVLGRRIIKSKGPIYDQLEEKVRNFLNNELASIFGTTTVSPNQFTNEEVELLKFFTKKLKENKR